MSILLIEMKGIEPIPGSFHPVSVPRFRGGGEITKIAIAPERGVRLLRPFGPLFWYVFTRESRPSHPTASPFAAPADQDVFWAFFCSCAWFFLSPRLARCSHILGINVSGIMTPACYLCCRGRLRTPISVWGPDLLLGRFNHFTYMQEALGTVYPSASEGFRVMICV